MRSYDKQNHQRRNERWIETANTLIVISGQLWAIMVIIVAHTRVLIIISGSAPVIQGISIT